MENSKNEQLIAAVKGKNNKNLIEKLIDSGADVNCRDELGFTALMCAVKVENLENVQTLLSHGVNVNEKAHTRGLTALILAAGDNNVGITQELLNGGADIELKTDPVGLTALAYAVERSCLDAVKLLLKHKANPECETPAKDTPLTLAIISENFKEETVRIGCVKELLAHGANIVEHKDIRGQTPLMLAASKNRIGVIGEIIISAALTGHDTTTYQKCYSNLSEDQRDQLKKYIDRHINNISVSTQPSQPLSLAQSAFKSVLEKVIVGDNTQVQHEKKDAEHRISLVNAIGGEKLANQIIGTVTGYSGEIVKAFFNKMMSNSTTISEAQSPEQLGGANLEV